MPRETLNTVVLTLPSPDVVRKEPNVWTGHPFKHQVNHKTLLDYCLSRLDLGAVHRDERVVRYREIDKQVIAYLELTTEDQKRKDKRDQTGQQFATEVNLPLLHVHLTDMLTYFTGIFASPTGMYSMLSDDPRQQALGNALTSIMNQDAVHADHFKAVIRACAAALRYNVGGLMTEWKEELGNRLSNVDGKRESISQKVWSGNTLIGVDMYNTLWDPRVTDPTEVQDRGEFCATIEPISFYELLKASQDGTYFNTEGITDPSGLSRSDRRLASTAGRVYYRSPAREVAPQDTTSESGRGQQDWDFFFGGTASPTGTRGVELVHTYIWVNPIQMKLIQGTKENKEKRSRLELWRITLAEGTRIIETTHMNNIHEQLPLTLGNTNESSLGEAQKSPAEYLQPLQTFASFALNTHVAATRKNIWGLILYNPDAVDLTDLPEGEVSGRLPIKSAYRGKDLQNIIWEHKGVLDTKQTTGDIKLSMDLLQNFYPTVATPSQIAGIDRAIEDQVAAVVQGANRRLQMAAQLLDTGMFKNSRSQQYSNIIQYRQEKISYVDSTKGAGNVEQIDPLELQELNIDEVMGQGLKAINREAAVKKLNALVFALLNSQSAAEYDMGAIISKVSQLDGIEVDLSVYRKPPPQQPNPADVAGVATGATANG